MAIASTLVGPDAARLHCQRRISGSYGGITMTDALDPRVADALLDALAGDDEFRDRFAADPDGALKQLGHTGGSIAPCCKLPLPDKHVIAEARDVLRAQLISPGNFRIFQL